VFEWGVLHHIMPPQREKYIQNVNQLLVDDGKYLSVCFNEQSPEFGRPGGGYRKSPIGTEIYYSSQDELRKLFEPYFQTIESKIITIGGRIGQKHIANYFLMEKR